MYRIRFSKGFICISRLSPSKSGERDFKDYSYLLDTQTQKFVNSFRPEKTSMIIIDSLMFLALGI